MADKNDDKAQDVPAQKLDSGYSQPTDTRTDPNDSANLNAPGSDFSDLKDSVEAKRDLPLDNTPAGKALGFSDGRPMTQQEEAVETDKK